MHVRAVYTADTSKWIPHFQDINPDKTTTTSNVPESFAVEQNDEHVVEKSTFDGFYGTELESILKNANIEQTLICGLVTSACVQG